MVWIQPLAQELPYIVYAAIKYIKKKKKLEFLFWLSGLRTQLVCMRVWVRSLALLNGLGIQYCCKLRSMLWMRLGSSISVAVA